MNNKLSFKRNSQTLSFYLKFVPLCFAIFFLAFSLLRFPENSTNGVRKGIDLCLSTLIPSLFPFMVLSSFFVDSGICEKIGKIFSKLTMLIFKQDGVGFSVILLSQIGGIPIGARLANQLYDNGKITLSQAQRLLLFCFNTGPAFVISGVGYFMLGSKEIGFVIYISQVMSSLILGFLTRFIFEDSMIYCKHISDNDTLELSTSQNLVKAVSSASSGMMSICAWVVIFSCLVEITKVFPLSEFFQNFINCTLEVTNACYFAKEHLPAHIISGILGFGGFCAHFQVMGNIIKLKLKFKYFLTARIISSTFSMLICYWLMSAFKLSAQTFATGKVSSTSFLSISMPVSIGLILMCALVLLGDNFRVYRSSKK